MESPTTQPTSEKKESIWELVRFAVIALIIVIPIRVFIAQPFIVSGTSMVPTFSDKDYLIVDEISYRFHEPARGDVIIFRYPNDPKKFFVKRIIALPNETISINSDGVVTIINNANPDGFELDEPYVKNMQLQSYPTTEIPESEYFVMGDNRSGSSDSRVWGLLPEKNIVGRALIRLVPFAHAGFQPGDHNFVN